MYVRTYVRTYVHVQVKMKIFIDAAFSILRARKWKIFETLLQKYKKKKKKKKNFNQFGQ